MQRMASRRSVSVKSKHKQESLGVSWSSDSENRIDEQGSADIVESTTFSELCFQVQTDGRRSHT